MISTVVCLLSCADIVDCIRITYAEVIRSERIGLRTLSCLGIHSYETEQI